MTERIVLDFGLAGAANTASSAYLFTGTYVTDPGGKIIIAETSTQAPPTDSFEDIIFSTLTNSG